MKREIKNQEVADYLGIAKKTNNTRGNIGLL